MKRLCSKITIGNFIFRSVCEVEVNSSWDNLTDTAKITLPAKLKWKGKHLVSGNDPLIKRGDPVSIELGYDFDYRTVFEGYLVDVKVKTPLEFICEDAMWKLKQKVITKSYRQVSLKQLLTDISPLKFECPDFNLGQFRISKATVAQVLEELKKTYGLRCWCRDGKLYVGTPYSSRTNPSPVTREFSFQENVPEDDLIYQRQEDVKLKVKGISVMPNNKRVEVEVGDPNGEQRTLHYYNKTEAELKAILKNEIERLKYEGYRGSFTAFGEPFVRHSDRVELKDRRFTDRKGRYWIKAVTYKFGMQGYRQVITIDRKA